MSAVPCKTNEGTVTAASSGRKSVALNASMLEQSPVERESPLSYERNLLRLGVERIHHKILFLRNDD